MHSHTISRLAMTITQHLESRHLNLALHRPIIDEAERTATFLLYNLSGQIVGYQQYKPDKDKLRKNNPKDGRYFTYQGKATVAVFGIESLHLTPHIVFIVEGIFDAARLTNRGVSAIAVLSNNPTQDTKNFLYSLGRMIVAVCDNDSAGKKLAKLGHVAVLTEGKDLGDSDEAFIDNLLSRFRLQPSTNKV